MEYFVLFLGSAIIGAVAAAIGLENLMFLIIGAGVIAALAFISMSVTFWVCVIAITIPTMMYLTFTNIPEGDDRIIDDSNRYQQDRLISNGR